MRRTPLAAFAASILAVTCSAFAQSADHQIRLDRLPERGSSWDVRVDARLEERAVSIVCGERHAIETQTVVVVLDAVATVDNVNEAGVPVAMNYLVNECTLTRDGITTIMAQPGSTLRVSTLQDGQTSFAVSGGTLQPSWIAALRIVAGLDAPSGLRDSVFGSTVPRSIGESWPVDDGLAMSAGGWAELSAGQGRVDGKTTLREVRRRDEMDCLLVEGRLEVTGSPAAGGPLGLEPTESRWMLHHESLLPVDGTLPAVEETSRTHAQLILHGRPRTPHEGAAVLLTSNRTVHTSRTLHAAPGFAAAPDDRP